MKYIIYNSELDAILKNEEITKKCISEGIWTDGITSSYCEVTKHPILKLFSIVIIDGYEQFFSEDEIKLSTEFTKDWFFMEDTKENLELKKQQLLDEIVVVDSKLSAIAVAVDDIAIDEIGK